MLTENEKTQIQWWNDEIAELRVKIQMVKMKRDAVLRKGKVSKPKEINLSQTAIDLVPQQGEILISTLCRKSNAWRLLCQKDLFIQYEVFDRNGLSTKDAPKGGRYVFRVKD